MDGRNGGAGGGGRLTYVLPGGETPFEQCYDVVRRLDKGAFGEVFEAFDLATGERMAVKVIKKEEEGVNFAKLRQEAEILKSLKHPHIVEFKHVGAALLTHLVPRMLRLRVHRNGAPPRRPAPPSHRPPAQPE